MITKKIIDLNIKRKNFCFYLFRPCPDIFKRCNMITDNNGIGIWL